MSDTSTSTGDFDLDNLTLDQIADLPSFGVWPTGAYLVTLTNGIQLKDINNKPVIEVAFTLDSVMELDAANLTKGKDEGTGDQEEPPIPGDIFSTIFQKTEDGVKYLKPILAAIVAGLQLPPGTKTTEIFAASKGVKGVLILARVWKPAVSRHNGRIIKFQLI